MRASHSVRKAPTDSPPNKPVILAEPLNSTLNTEAGSEFPLRSRPDPKCPAADPWLRTEHELLSSLRLDDAAGRNQCILTGKADEDYPIGSELLDCYNPNAESSRFCRFPGDHTEALGVRRIHYENALGNMVMRLPRVLVDPTKPFSDCTDPSSPRCVCSVGTRPCPADKQAPQNLAIWAVPPDGYAVTFTVVGTLRSYEVLAQTAAQDVSSGILAQGLRSAAVAPSGVLFIVDEGRTGGISSLRGQVLRIVGSQVDPIFLLR